jgi:DNA polymerase-3 subunit gamma/tau
LQEIKKENIQEKDSVYRVLARKYRPLSFKNLVGQEALVTTISTAIKFNKIAHGYLLSGIRGVGKTTTARIIARTINCTELTYDNNIPEPCFSCKNCKEMDKESHPDLIEIDAASRTGVADIRELIENSRYKPMLGKYKIYIIDEVHMLSLSAFNALLKTLEEPPEHIIFILATTELRKIPITIMSRCQRFQLRRLNKDEIIGHLQNIAAQENIKLVTEAFEVIAEKSEGSVRDSLSLLNQVIISWNSNEPEIDLKFTLDILGIADKKSIFELLNFILLGQVSEAHKVVRSIYYQGIHLYYVLDELIEMLADILKHKTTGEITNPCYINADYQQFIQDNSIKISTNSLLYLWQILTKGRIEIQRSANQISTCEIIIIKACYICGHISNESKQEYINPAPMSQDPVVKVSHIVQQDAKTISLEDANQKIRIPKDLALEEREVTIKNSPTQEKKSEQAVKTYNDFVEVFRKNGEMIIYHSLCNDLIPIEFNNNLIKLGAKEAISKAILNEIITTYKKLTSIDINIDFVIVNEGYTIEDKKNIAKEEQIEKISMDKNVQKLLDTFTDSKVIGVD